MTQAEIQFCKHTCDTAAAKGISVRPLTDIFGLPSGYEWKLPSGQTLATQGLFCGDRQDALHAACKNLARHFQTT